MTRKGLGCLGVAVLTIAAVLGFCAWALTTEFGDFTRENLKSRAFEHRLQSERIDHDAIRESCEALLQAMGTHTRLVLKDHNTATDPRVPEVIRALDPDSIVVLTNNVDLTWHVPLGACGLKYYADGADLDQEMADMERSFNHADRTDQVVRVVADRVLFYRYRLELLGL